MAYLLLHSYLSETLEKSDTLAAVICVILYGVGFVGKRLFPNVFQIWTMLQFVIYFVAGFKIRQYGSDVLMRIPGVAWFLSHVILFAASQVLSGSNAMVIKLLAFGLSIINTMLGALMSFVVLQKLAMRVKRIKVYAKWLSSYSMPIYLVHQQIVYLFILLFKDRLSPLPHAAINFVGVFALSLLLAMALTKFKITRFLVGEK